jgi:hypothetical protein
MRAALAELDELKRDAATQHRRLGDATGPLAAPRPNCGQVPGLRLRRTFNADVLVGLHAQ